MRQPALIFNLKEVFPIKRLLAPSGIQPPKLLKRLMLQLRLLIVGQLLDAAQAT